jgi:GNAT superfamily N-acetyltransferase
MTLGPFQPYAEDLAPGDSSALEQSWTDFEVCAVESADDPLFEQAWERLWREFGARGEMERPEVIRERFGWNSSGPVGGHAMLYEMIVVRSEGRTVAVRDHTAIVVAARDHTFVSPPSGADADDTGAPGVVVHLSHVVVEPEMRGRGLAAWLRAMPIAAARRCVSNLGDSAMRDSATRAGITLLAEMEPDDEMTSDVRRRLRSYARAGFRVVDPNRVAYAQPDFRSAADIARTGEKAVPLWLVVRRVGREHENSIPARELLRIVGALQAMFAVHVDHAHMERIRRLVSPEAIGSEDISLLVPGVAPPDDRRILK